jgi:hypothetical protein
MAVGCTAQTYPSSTPYSLNIIVCKNDNKFIHLLPFLKTWPTGSRDEFDKRTGLVLGYFEPLSLNDPKLTTNYPENISFSIELTVPGYIKKVSLFPQRVSSVEKFRSQLVTMEEKYKSLVLPTDFSVGNIQLVDNLALKGGARTRARTEKNLRRHKRDISTCRTRKTRKTHKTRKTRKTHKTRKTTRQNRSHHHKEMIH